MIRERFEVPKTCLLNAPPGHDDGVEVEHAGVHEERGERARGDHNGLEALDHGADGDGGVQAPVGLN